MPACQVLVLLGILGGVSLIVTIGAAIRGC